MLHLRNMAISCNLICIIEKYFISNFQLIKPAKLLISLWIPPNFSLLEVCFVLEIYNYIAFFDAVTITNISYKPSTNQFNSIAILLPDNCISTRTLVHNSICKEPLGHY